MNPTIRVENASKRFMVRRERYRSFQDIFVNVGRRRSRAEEFWALRDVSLTVQPGETVGIIGSNGSGKSTLLKLITRIFDPTSGTVRVSGRVSALLELGAGFHPDLSGRDNVYLNWSLLGMSRKQVDLHFDEIVAFAELEEFIDLPVRLYSSGMYIRLAFAAAIAIKSDVLIIDEVLAVGDVAFQEKCYSRIHEAKRDGRSILIVSHGLEGLEKICDRLVWLDHGRLAYEGMPHQTIAQYLGTLSEREEAALEKSDSEAERDAISTVASQKHAPLACDISRVRLLNAEGSEQHIFVPYEPMRLEIGYTGYGRRDRPLSATVTIRRDDGIEVHQATSAAHQIKYSPETDDGVITLFYDSLGLAPGRYTVDVGLAPASDPLRLLVSRDSVHHLIMRSSTHRDQGLVAMPCRWDGSIQKVPLNGSVSQNGVQGVTSQQTLEWAPMHAAVAEVSERFLEGCWHDPEGDSESFRWMGENASVFLMAHSPRGRLHVAFFNTLANTGRSASRLTILIDGVKATEVAIDAASSTVACDFQTRAPKVVKITLAVDRAVRPADLGHGDDPRPLGVAVREVWIEAVASNLSSAKQVSAAHLK